MLKREDALLWFGDFSQPWQRHCKNVAELSEIMASHIVGLDSDFAYVYGLVHDIGRATKTGREFPKSHPVEGYLLMESKGYPEEGMSCLTHSFPDPSNMMLVPGFCNPAWNPDCDINQIKLDYIDTFIKEKLENYRPTLYDTIVCLADLMSLGGKTVTIEERLKNVKERYGAKPNDELVLKAINEKKEKIERMMSTNLEDVITFY